MVTPSSTTPLIVPPDTEGNTVIGRVEVLTKTTCFPVEAKGNLVARSVTVAFFIRFIPFLRS